MSDGKGEISTAVDSTGIVRATFPRGIGSSWELTYASKIGGSWEFQRIDARSDGASLVLDTSDQPHISYNRVSDNTVRYAHRGGAFFFNETIEQVNCTAYTTSLALDTKGAVHVTYWNYCESTPPYLSYLRHAVRNESGWTIETVGTGWPNFPADIAPIAVDSTGHPHIAVLNLAEGTPPGGLRYLSWNGSGWSNELASAPSDGSDLEELSFKLDSNDVPHIVYSDHTYEIERYSRYDAMFRSWRHQNVHVWPPSSFHISFARISLAIDWRNLPSVSFMDHTDGSLMYAYSDGANWFAENVQASPPNDGSSALGLDSLGAPHIVYGQVNWNGSSLPVGHAWQVWPDNVLPSSSVEPIVPHWHNTQPLLVTATAIDQGSGVADVTLWYRQSSDNITWGGWAKHSTLDSPPWAWPFPFPAGEGYYEFYSTAIDVVGNVEAPPPTADAIAGCDITPPVSTALPISPYWQTTPSLTVTATATDSLSGVANVTLLYSHAPLGNASWSPWTPLGTKASPPWSWPFPFPDGEGNYKFHTIAIDAAGNMEGSKDYAEAVTGYRIPPDYQPVNPLPSSSATVGLSLPIQLSIEVLNSGGFENINATLAIHNESSPSSPFLKIQVPPIPAGSTSGPFTATWTSPGTSCACHVVANVDYYDNVTESNETNNTYTWTVNVVAGPMTYLSIGNPNYTSTVTYVKSTTPLDLSVVDQSGLGIRNTTYTIDGGSPVNYTATGTFFLVAEGVHTIEWRSLDWVGNLEDVSSMELTVDDTPPATSLSIGQPKYLVGGRFVDSSTPMTLSAADGGVGSNSTFYRLWDGAWSSWLPYSSPFSLAGRDGTWFVEFLSYDRLENGEAAQNETIVLDNAPPVTTIVSAAVFTLTAVDPGCGVHSTMYRIDGGAWMVYSGGFIVPEGAHNISFYSVDNLNNTEQEGWLVVKPPPDVAANYKPMVALIFAIILLVAGVWSSKKRPWKGGKERMAVVKTFAITSLPFVLAEAGTGFVSMLTGQLSIPPLVGAGTVVDLSILIAGMCVVLLRAYRPASLEAKGDDDTDG